MEEVLRAINILKELKEEASKLKKQLDVDGKGWHYLSGKEDAFDYSIRLLEMSLELDGEKER